MTDWELWWALARPRVRNCIVLTMIFDGVGALVVFGMRGIVLKVKFDGLGALVGFGAPWDQKLFPGHCFGNEI